jgi:adenylate cyclase
LTIPIQEIKDPILKRVWGGEDLPKEHIIQDAGVILKHIQIERSHYLVVMRELTGYGPQTWYTGAWFPADEIGGASLHRLFLSGLLGVITLLLGVGAAIFLGRRIARPIAHSAKAQAQIGQLDINCIQELPPSFFRELTEQASAFNTMVGALKAFERYVPKKLVTALMQKSLTLDTLSEERELTVMFTDIAGFTSLSENLTAQEVADFLNEHFTLLGECVEKEGATIDKYIGDALMAFWGAPEVQSNAPLRACRAALDIVRSWEAYNQKRLDAGKEVIRMRIGLHSGPVVVGNIGFPGRINYTIVGDTVNTCQRLESLGKEVDAQATAIVLISDAVREGLNGQFFSQEAGHYGVKGKAEPIPVYRLFASP